MTSKISIRTVGASNPDWMPTAVSCFDTWDFEILRVFEEGAPAEDEKGPANRRFIIAAQHVDLSRMPKGALTILTDAPSIDGITEALSRIMMGNHIVGLAVSDVLELISAKWASDQELSENERRFSLNGKAKGASYNCSEKYEPVAIIRNYVLDLAKGGFDQGICIVQLLSSEESPLFSLAEFDAFTTEILRNTTFCKALITAALNCSSSALIIVTFPQPAN